MATKYANVQILPAQDVIEALAEQMRKTPALLDIALKRNASRFKSRLMPLLQEEPGPPHYPIRWKSEKQKRAFFATDGFGRGIGAPRTHALSQGWRIDVKGNNFFELDVYNTRDYTRFVVGDDKQPFHMDTGWYDFAKIMQQAQEDYEDTVIDTFFTVGDPTAGIL